MINRLPSLESADVSRKKVFVRCDFDVPLNQELRIKNSELRIADESRLVACISTIEYLLENGATVIAVGHIGRPEAANGKPITDYSLEPVARWFADEFPDSNLTSQKLGEFDGWQIKENFYLLENLRFN